MFESPLTVTDITNLERNVAQLQRLKAGLMEEYNQLLQDIAEARKDPIAQKLHKLRTCLTEEKEKVAKLQKEADRITTNILDGMRKIRQYEDKEAHLVKRIEELSSKFDEIVDMLIAAKPPEEKNIPTQFNDYKHLVPEL